MNAGSVQTDGIEPPNQALTPGKGAGQRWMVLACFSAGILIALLYHPFQQMEKGDTAIWDYVAQSIVRGDVPYRDVVEIKTPADAYLSAAAIAAGRIIGAPDVISIRLLSLLLIGTLCALTFIIAERYFHNWASGVLACFIILSTKVFMSMIVCGTEPKLLMIICGLLTLFLIERNKPYLAGLFSAISFLSWQPGLLFTGIALLVYSRYLAAWRDKQAFKVLLGAFTPIAVTVIYFVAAGALGDFWRWNFVFNVTVYGPDQVKELSKAFAHLLYAFDLMFQRDAYLIELTFAGFVIYLARNILNRISSGKILPSSGIHNDAILLSITGLILFSLINMQREDDVIPILPFVGLFCGYFIIEIEKCIILLFKKLKRFLVNKKGPAIGINIHIEPDRLRNIIVGFFAIAFLVLSVKRGAAHHINSGATLKGQQAAFSIIDEKLSNDGKIYAHGAAEVLFLLNRKNLNPYIFLDRGKDRYIASRIDGGFDGFLDQIKKQEPAVVILWRIRHVEHKKDLLRWVSSDYDKLPIGFDYDDIFIRQN